MTDFKILREVNSVKCWGGWYRAGTKNGALNLSFRWSLVFFVKAVAVE